MALETPGVIADNIVNGELTLALDQLFEYEGEALAIMTFEVLNLLVNYHDKPWRDVADQLTRLIRVRQRQETP